jgi:RimJ/RimL family protein N-acetyltransferase
MNSAQRSFGIYQGREHAWPTQPPMCADMYGWWPATTVDAMEPLESWTTERLVLRRPVEDDVESVLAYWSDPEVHRFLQIPVSDDRAEAQGFLRHLASAWEKGRVLVGGLSRLPRDGSSG